MSGLVGEAPVVRYVSGVRNRPARAVVADFFKDRVEVSLRNRDSGKIMSLNSNYERKPQVQSYESFPDEKERERLMDVLPKCLAMRNYGGLLRWFFGSKGILGEFARIPKIAYRTTRRDLIRRAEGMVDGMFLFAQT